MGNIVINMETLNDDKRSYDDLECLSLLDLYQVLLFARAISAGRATAPIEELPRDHLPQRL